MLFNYYSLELFSTPVFKNITEQPWHFSKTFANHETFNHPLKLERQRRRRMRIIII